MAHQNVFSRKVLSAIRDMANDQNIDDKTFRSMVKVMVGTLLSDSNKTLEDMIEFLYKAVKRDNVKRTKKD